MREEMHTKRFKNREKGKMKKKEIKKMNKVSAGFCGR